MEIIKFNKVLPNHQAVVTRLIELAKNFDNYKKSHNQLSYVLMCNALNDLKSVLDFSAESAVKINELFTQDEFNKGYHGSQKNETHGEFWSENING